MLIGVSHDLQSIVVTPIPTTICYQMDYRPNKVGSRAKSTFNSMGLGGGY